MEEQTENENRKCQNCGDFERYYTRGQHRFERAQHGFCYKRCEIVERKWGCECWRSRRRIVYIRKRAATAALNEILNELSAVRQIIQEDKDEGGEE